MNQNEINKVVENAEAIGREEFKQLCDRERWCKVHKFSEKKMARWDVSFFEDKIQVVGDIKKRRYNSDTFNDWYFEVEKAESLLQLAKLSGNDTKIGYIHLFNDNIMWLWTFSEEELAKLNTKMVQVQKNDWSDELVWKKVYCLTNGQASKKEEIDLTKSIFNK